MRYRVVVLIFLLAGLSSCNRNESLDETLRKAAETVADCGSCASKAKQSLAASEKTVGKLKNGLRDLEIKLKKSEDVAAGLEKEISQLEAEKADLILASSARARKFLRMYQDDLNQGGVSEVPIDN